MYLPAENASETAFQIKSDKIFHVSHISEMTVVTYPKIFLEYRFQQGIWGRKP